MPVLQKGVRVFLQILVASAVLAQTGDEGLDIYTEHPRIFLGAQRLRLLRRERERRTTRWLQIGTLMTGKAVMPGLQAGRAPGSGEAVYALVEMMHAVRDNANHDMRHPVPAFFKGWPIFNLLSYYPATFPAAESDYRIPAAKGIPAEPDLTRA